MQMVFINPERLDKRLIWWLRS